MHKMLQLQAGWLTAVLLTAMVAVAAWGVQAAGWDAGLWSLWLIGALGVLAGWTLARSRFPGWLAFVFALAYGLFGVSFFIASFSFEGTAHERAVELLARLNEFFYKAFSGGTSRDTLPFAFIVSLAFWAIGASAAWAVFRRSAAWGAIIPGGLALLVNAYYYLGPRSLDEYLATYVLLALMLLARMSLLAREREWRAARVQYNPDMRFEFLRAGLMVALAGVLLAWAGPTLAASPAAAAAWEEVTQPWKYVREGWTRLFSAVRSYGQGVSDFYGDSLVLTGAARLSNARIVDVRVGPPPEEGDVEPERPAPPEGRYYWHALSFDTYVDGRWVVAEVESINHLPDRLRWQLPPYQLRRDLLLTFTAYVPMTRLYTVTQPLWVDRRAVFDLVYLPDNLIDVASVRAQKPVRSGETYQVAGSVSFADMESLRAAGTDYPDWVTERYLQIPRTVTARTWLLASQIVERAGAVTPYDQAQAITDWLRANITYDDTIGAPPPQVEPVEFALFYSRRGFCNYYASAEVMLLRELGIPARLAVGFAEGSYTSAGYYQVLEKDAHAWPEVFFPNYGWVEFEPTAAQPPLIRPERRVTAADLSPDATSPTPDAAVNAQPTREPGRPDDETEPTVPVTPRSWLDSRILSVVLTLLAVGVLAAAGLAVTMMLRAELIGLDSLGVGGRVLMRLRGMPVPSAIGLIYLNLERAARWLGLPLPPALTPHERAGALGAELPPARDPAQIIADQYVAERYGAQSADAQVAASAWGGVRGLVWRRGVVNFLRRLGERLVRRFEAYWQGRRRRGPGA